MQHLFLVLYLAKNMTRKIARLFLFLRMFPLSNPWETLLRKQTLENDAGIGSSLPAFENFQLKL
jgi:hypothetical protein